jgi:hypothetical protein
LINKAKFWTSKDDWTFASEGDEVYIKNLSKNKVLVFRDNEVYEEDLDPNVVEQMWLLKDIGDPEGYVSLQNKRSEKGELLTATPSKRLEVKGMYRVYHQFVNNLKNIFSEI